MSQVQAAVVVRALADAGIRCWVMGGWGVDALLGKVTREHHDLDLLVPVDDLPALDAWLVAEEFARLHEWDEDQPVDRGGRSFSTAFVARHPDGRELDVHAVDVEDDGRFALATTDPWVLPADALDGRGEIGGVAVPCVSRAAQRAMHVGYELPPHHVRDLESLALRHA